MEGWGGNIRDERLSENGGGIDKHKGSNEEGAPQYLVHLCFMPQFDHKITV